MNGVGRIRTAGWMAAGVTAISMLGVPAAAHALTSSVAVKPPPTVSAPPLSLAAKPRSRVAALPKGSCSGAAACNDFIVKCAVAGGDYVPGRSYDSNGASTSGTCGPAQPRP